MNRRRIVCSILITNAAGSGRGWHRDVSNKCTYFLGEGKTSVMARGPQTGVFLL